MTLRIGELAVLTGEHVRTLRFWTDRGLLPADRADNTYRVYGPEAWERVVFIRTAQALGLSLDAIGRLLNLAQTGGRPCTQVLAELEVHLGTVREQLARLTRLEQTLAAHLREAQEVSCDDSGCRFLPQVIGPA